MWAISRRSERGDATKLDDFWEASPFARSAPLPDAGQG